MVKIGPPRHNVAAELLLGLDGSVLPQAIARFIETADALEQESVGCQSLIEPEILEDPNPGALYRDPVPPGVELSCLVDSDDPVASVSERSSHRKAGNAGA